MTITQLQGGLGNQLFQYTAAVFAEHGHSEDICVDTTYYAYVPNRKYALSRLGLKCRQITFWDFPLEAPLSLPMIGPLWKKPYAVFGHYFLNEEQKTFTFDKRLDKKKNQYLIGFWQHHSYPQKYKQQLKKSITFPRHTNSTFLAKVQQTESVSLHVRRGDYVHNAAFALTDFSYYKNALQLIKDRHKKLTFFIFSDDIPWCKKEFQDVKNVIFIDEKSDEVTDLFLMKSCKHHILANSTFSWWGAFLGFDESTVIMPKKWIANPASVSALHCKKWIQL